LVVQKKNTGGDAVTDTEHGREWRWSVGQKKNQTKREGCTGRSPRHNTQNDVPLEMKGRDAIKEGKEGTRGKKKKKKAKGRRGKKEGGREGHQGKKEKNNKRLDQEQAQQQQLRVSYERTYRY